MKKLFTALAIVSSAFFGAVTPAVAETVVNRPLAQVQQADMVVQGPLVVLDAEDSENPVLMLTVANNGNLRTKAFRTKISYHLFAGDDDADGEGRVVNLERTISLGLRPGKTQKFRLNPASNKISLDEVEWVEVIVDSRKAVVESNEDNNRATFYFDDQDDEGIIPSREGASMIQNEQKNVDKSTENYVKEISKSDTTKDSGQKKEKVLPKLNDIPWRTIRQYSGSVYLTSLYPTQATIGTQVLVRGNGFLREGNAVLFDNGYILNIPSPDLETLSFAVPEDRTPLCVLTQPACLLPAPYNLVKPGEYKIAVLNGNGWSAPLSLKVVAKDDLKSDPYKPVYNDAICLSLGALLPGCHKLPENDAVRFDSTETKYVYMGTTYAKKCADSPVLGCNRASLLTNYATTTPAVIPPPVVTASTSAITTNNLNTTAAHASTANTATTASSPTATALAYRSGLYFKDAWTGCMTRMASTVEMKKVQDYLNAGQFPPPWGVFTGAGATAIATCEREAGWTGYESGSGSGGMGTNGSWVSHTWRFKDNTSNTSYILSRTDSEYTTYISSLDASAVQGYFGGWRPAGGDQSNWREFGIPVVSPTVTSQSGNGSNSGGTPPSGGYGYSSAEAQAGCTSAGGTWNSTSMYCQMPGSGSASGSSSAMSCGSGTYWNGSSCVSNSSSNTSSCSSGQYWNGSACVNNTTSGSSSGASCTSSQYWNGSACVTGSYSSDPSTACTQAGGTWSSSSNYCQMPNTSGTSGGSMGGMSTEAMMAGCATAGGTWAGTYCRMPGMSSRAPSVSQLANMSSALEVIKALLRQLR